MVLIKKKRTKGQKDFKREKERERENQWHPIRISLFIIFIIFLNSKKLKFVKEQKVECLFSEKQTWQKSPLNKSRE